VRDEQKVRLNAYHEAAHAVFAYRDDIGVDSMCVSSEQGNCAIPRADPYERYLPLRYVQFCPAGAYAATPAAYREHPEPEQMSLSWLLAKVSMPNANGTPRRWLSSTPAFPQTSKPAPVTVSPSSLRPYESTLPVKGTRSSRKYQTTGRAAPAWTGPVWTMYGTSCVSGTRAAAPARETLSSSC
jgi:hypothetical protein